jgi:uncharacterized membrane protein (TIGR02234 family)
MTPARRLALVLLALACAAVGLWVATRLVWLRMDYHSALRGGGTVRVSGGTVRPELGAVALVALAAGAASVAVSGPARRVLGGLVALVGAWTVWLSLAPSGFPEPVVPGGAASAVSGGVGHPPADAVPIGSPGWTAAPYLGLAAGVLLGLAGVGLVGWAGAMPRLGTRYAAPGTGRRAPDRDARWWNALDAGEDPTVTTPPRVDGKPPDPHPGGSR